MSGILQTTTNGGVAPALTVNSFDPATINPVGPLTAGLPPINSDLLYFPSSCPTRITPAFLNSLSSEIMCVVAKAGNAYDGNSLCNLSNAIESLIQFHLSTPASAPVAAAPGSIV